jgi:hypothetical protein
MRIVKFAKALLLLATIGAATAPAAFACSCACAPDAERQVEGAALVFDARVEGQRIAGGERLVSVRVTARRKGEMDETMVLRTATSSAACGVTGLKTGESYIFLANPADRPGFAIDQCGMMCAERYRAAIETILKPCAPGAACPGR